MDKLYRLKFCGLDGISEESVAEFLASQFKLTERQIEKFLSGKFVFKPCKEKTVDKTTQLLEKKGIKCSKHVYAQNEVQSAPDEKDLKIKELQRSLEKANEQIAKLEEQIYQNAFQDVSYTSDVDEFEKALLQDDIGSVEEKARDNVATLRLNGESHSPDGDEANLTAKGKWHKMAFLLISIAFTALAAYLYVFSSEEEAKTIIMDYSGFAQRNNISVEEARILAEELGSITKMTEYEVDAQRRNMDLISYLQWRPYAEQCKADKMLCKNAKDFVTVHLDGTFVMNQYKANCEEYVRQQQTGEIEFGSEAFNTYDEKSTAFKTSDKLTLMADVRMKGSAGVWESTTIYCQLNTPTALIHHIDII